VTIATTAVLRPRLARKTRRLCDNLRLIRMPRDPGILGARTRADKDIFYNPEAGLPRAEREL
jgi:hypothetical protein